MAEIKVPFEADYESIALAAGAEPGTAMYWNDGTVRVPGVEQSSLNAALARYDHGEALQRRMDAEIEAESKPTLEERVDDMRKEIDELKRGR